MTINNIVNFYSMMDNGPNIKYIWQSYNTYILSWWSYKFVLRLGHTLDKIETECHVFYQMHNKTK